MLFRLFRKQSDSRPRFEQDASIVEALQRRVDAIEFRPSKGFLKDQRQPKRSALPPRWTVKRKFGELIPNIYQGSRRRVTR